MKTIYWSRQPGKFVNKRTGEEIVSQYLGTPMMFGGTTQEWWETLGSVIYDAIENKDCKITVSSDIVTILQHTSYYKPVNSEEYCGLLFNEQIPVYVDKLQNHDEAFVISGKIIVVIKVLDMDKP